ncbi:MAG: mechanosensitive ion channel family protein [Prochlorococcus sp.]
MKILLLEIIGWLGYLQRWSVILQFPILAVFVIAEKRILAQPIIRRVPKQARHLMAPLLAFLVSIVLMAIDLPAGLIQFLSLAWLGWRLLELLDEWLLKKMPPRRAHELQSRLIKPFFLIFISLSLVNQLDSLEDLALIPMGNFLGAELHLGQVITSALITYIVLIGSGPPAAGLAWFIQRCLGIEDGSRKALELILRFSVMGLGLLGVFYGLGVQGTGLIAITGGLSVGIGLGLKELISNFASGIWLLIEGSVRPGEVLMIDSDACEVKRLGLRATLLLRRRDNAELLIPNNTFFSQTTTTYTSTDRMRRGEVNIGAAYHHDPTIIMKLLEETAQGIPKVLKFPAPRALTMSYGDFSINYILRFYIADPLDNIGTCSEMNKEIWASFKREGITIPFPQSQIYPMEWPPQAFKPMQQSAERSQQAET